MENEKAERLCDLFMRRMRIEGDDGTERELVLDFVKSGIGYLNCISCGADVDFETDTRAKELLYNYVFYSRNECLAEFEKNYGAMLRAFRNTARVRARKEQGDEET